VTDRQTQTDTDTGPWLVDYSGCIASLGKNRCSVFSISIVIGAVRRTAPIRNSFGQFTELHLSTVVNFRSVNWTIEFVIGSVCTGLNQWHSVLLWDPSSRTWRGPSMHCQGLLSAYLDRSAFRPILNIFSLPCTFLVAMVSSDVEVAGSYKKLSNRRWTARCVVSGLPRSSFAEIFGVRKLESLDYHVMLFVWSYV